MTKPKSPPSTKAPPKAPAKLRVATPRHNIAPVSVLARIPHDILAGLDRRVVRGDFKSRNIAIARAVLELADLTPKLKAELWEEFMDEPLSVGSLVATSQPDAPVPGSRLDKSTIGRSAGKAKPAKGARGKPAAAADEDEVIV